MCDKKNICSSSLKLNVLFCPPDFNKLPLMKAQKEAYEQSNAVEKEKRFFEAQVKQGASSRKATNTAALSSLNTVTQTILILPKCTKNNLIDDGPSFVPLGGSFPLNINDLLDDPLMPDLEDTAEV
ncbi:hypothetical protein Tco_1109012 [Tanacetum coccineum]